MPVKIAPHGGDAGFERAVAGDPGLVESALQLEAAAESVGAGGRADHDRERSAQLGRELAQLRGEALLEAAPVAAEAGVGARVHHQPVDGFVLGDGAHRGFELVALEHEAGVERVAHGGAGDGCEAAQPLLRALAEPGHRDARAVADVGGQHGDAAAAAQHGGARAGQLRHALDCDRDVEQLVDAVGGHEAALALHGAPDLRRAGQRAGVRVGRAPAGLG